MVGNQQPPKPDPFQVGQYVGMMVILTFIENNNGINKDFLAQLKAACAEQSAEAMDQPTEDVYLMVDELVKKIKVE